MHGLLHGRLEVLHAEAQPVEPQPGKNVKPVVVHRAGVDLDRVLASGRELEAAPQHGHELAELVVAEECGRSAAEMQLAHGLALPQLGRVQVHLARKIAQVLGRTVLVLGDDLVAGAVIAQRLAERHMHVERQRKHERRRTRAALAQGLQVLDRAEGLDKAVGRGIRGVPGPGHIMTTQQIWRNGRNSLDVHDDPWMLRLCPLPGRVVLTCIKCSSGSSLILIKEGKQSV